MTITIFLFLMIILCSISSLFTEALKIATKRRFSSNLIALADAALIGGGGSAIAYVWLGIPFTLANVLVIPCMVFAVWIGSMIGYDKVIQLIKQIAEARPEQ